MIPGFSAEAVGAGEGTAVGAVGAGASEALGAGGAASTAGFFLAGSGACSWSSGGAKGPGLAEDAFVVFDIISGFFLGCVPVLGRNGVLYESGAILA